jgi:hypothetical protein
MKRPWNRCPKGVPTRISAGTKAFPVLVAHRGDIAKASHVFQRVVFDVDASGNATFHLPTIGDACFDVLQAQVEGEWLKGYRQYHVLSPETVAEWWELHKTKSLRELRLETARLSLEAARKDFRKDRAPFHKQAVEFFEKHLKDIN